MKYLQVLLLFFIIAIHWIWAKDSLLVTITLDKHEFLLDEPIWCEFRVTNVADHPIGFSLESFGFKIIDLADSSEYPMLRYGDSWFHYRDSIPALLPGDSRYHLRDLHNTINKYSDRRVVLQNGSPHIGQFRIEAVYNDCEYEHAYANKLFTYPVDSMRITNSLQSLVEKYMGCKKYIFAKPESISIAQPTGIDSIIHLLLVENIEEFYTIENDNYPQRSRIFMEFLNTCPNSSYTMVGFDYLMRAKGGYRLKHMTFDPIEYLVQQNNLSIYPWLDYISSQLPVDSFPPDVKPWDQKKIRLRAFKSRVTNPLIQEYIDNKIAGKATWRDPDQNFIPVDHTPPE